MPSYNNHNYSADQIIIILREECESRGRRLTVNDLKAPNWDGPRMSLIRKRFGTFTNAMNEVNYETPEEKKARQEREVKALAEALVSM